MPLLADRVRETTTTVGTGTITLAGAVTGFQSFNTAFANGNTVYYVIQGGTEWEIGIGTVGTGTLARTTVLQSSNADALVPFSAGIKDVFVAYVADRAVTTSDAATLTNKTIDDYTNNVGANSTHFRIKASGSIAKGTVVKAIGFTPGEAAIEVAAVSSVNDIALGLAEQTLTSGQFGTAIVIGELFDVNTNGLSVGAILYTNGTGGYTTTKPSSGQYQPLGWVVRANLNNGVIAVNVVTPLTVEASTNTANTLVLRDGSGNFAAGTITANLTGNVSGTAGSVAAANITGTTLASNVTGSSLTSVGTLSSLTVSGNLTVDTTTLVVDATNNRVSVGGTQSEAVTYGVPALGVGSNSFTAFHVESHSNTPIFASFIGMMRSRGTQASPTHLVSGDTIGLLTSVVYNDAGVGAYRPAANIGFIATDNHAIGSLPTAITFSTTPSGSNNVAERVRIAANGNVGIGTTSPATRLHIATETAGVDDVVEVVRVQRNTSGTAAVNIGAAVNFVLERSDGGLDQAARVVGAFSNVTSGVAAGYLRFDTAINGTQTERMRLDSSGNLGIGTSSPTSRLHIVGNQFRHTDATVSQGYVINTTSATTTLATLFGGSSFAIQTAASGTNQLLLDAAGNLGLGVTPSAWLANSRVVQLGGGASIEGRAGTPALMQVSANAFIDASGTDRYIATIAASRYTQTSGSHRWLIAPSGTGGDAITFTQAMTLDANGNLAIGRTSVTTIGSGYRTVHLDGTNGSGLVLSTNGTTTGYVYTDSGAVTLEAAGARTIKFGNDALLRWQISTAGHLLAGADALYDIGASGANRPRDIRSARYMQAADFISSDVEFRLANQPYSRVAIYNTASGAFAGGYNLTLSTGSPVHNSTAALSGYYYQDDGSIRFYAAASAAANTAAAERMRITSAGNVGIGTNAPGKKLVVNAIPNATIINADGIIANYDSSSTSVYLPIGFSWASSTGTNAPYWGMAMVGTNYASAQADLTLFTSGLERVRVTNAGNVGINTTAPDYRLDVNGSFGFTPGTSVTPVANGDVVIEATNNTTLTFKLKGSDGTVRTGTITLA